MRGICKISFRVWAIENYINLHWLSKKLDLITDISGKSSSYDYDWTLKNP